MPKSLLSLRTLFNPESTHSFIPTLGGFLTATLAGLDFAIHALEDPPVRTIIAESAHPLKKVGWCLDGLPGVGAAGRHDWRFLIMMEARVESWMIYYEQRQCEDWRCRDKDG